MNAFDFESVHKIIVLLKWTYQVDFNDSCEIPSVENLKKFAESLLFNSLQHRCEFSGSGFEAKYIVGYDGSVKLRLCFVPVFSYAAVDSMVYKRHLPRIH
jgi:hypothetical protein